MLTLKRGEEAGTIAEKLGYLPLALDQAGRNISARQISLSKYFVEYDSKFKTVATTTHPGLLERYKYLFYTTWKVSVDSLCPASSQILHLCAFLGTKDIVEALLRRIVVE